MFIWKTAVKRRRLCCCLWLSNDCALGHQRPQHRWQHLLWKKERKKRLPSGWMRKGHQFGSEIFVPFSTLIACGSKNYDKHWGTSESWKHWCGCWKICTANQWVQLEWTENWPNGLKPQWELGKVAIYRHICSIYYWKLWWKKRWRKQMQV